MSVINGSVKKKRITVDATPFMFSQGGVGRVTQKLMSTIESMDQEFELNMYARRFQGKPLNSEFINGSVKHFKLPKFCESLMKSLGVIEHYAKADLYHATDHYLPIKLSSNYIVTIHDLIFLTAPEKRWKIHDYLARHVPSFVHNSKHVITCSEFTKNDIVKYIGVSPDKISVIPWGIDHELFSPAVDHKQNRDFLFKKFKINTPYFLAVACSEGRKNTPLLIEAWKQIAKKCCDYKLVLVWDPPEQIIGRCNKEDLTGSVLFTGKVDDITLRNLYRGSVCVVYPSTYEGFGLPILEAMSSGVPVITSNTSSMPEVGGNLAIYVDPYDINSIAQAILKFIDNPQISNMQKISLIDHARRFNWKKCAEQTIEIYKRFI